MKDPPEGLPVGWTCVENIYRSGRCKGHTYLRYTSPWGQRGFMSITASQKAHAQWMGQDVESIVPRQHHKKLTSSGASSSKSGQNGGTSSVQKCIYKVPGGTGSAPSYYCLCMYQCFRIRTRCTKSLAEAIDWHIALAGAREAAQLRIRSSACDGPPVPLLESERDEVLKAVPAVELYFTSHFSKGRFQNICTPTLQDLDLAMRLRERYWQALHSSARSPEVLGKLRIDAVAEAAESRKSIHLRSAMVLKAVRSKLHALQSNVALVDEVHQPVVGMLALQDKTLAAEASSPCSRSARPVGMLALPVGIKAPTVRLPTARKTPPTSRRAASALRFVNALGLSVRAMNRAAVFLNSLSVEQRQRRVEALLKTPRQRASPPSCRRLALCLPTSSPASSQLGLLGTQQLQLLDDRCNRREGGAYSLEWMSQLPYDTSPVAALTLREKCAVQQLCLGAAAFIDAGNFRQCRSFTYAAVDMEEMQKRSRFGRKITAARSTATSHRLVRFLASPLAARAIELLDLRNAPIAALLDYSLQKAMASMSRLRSVVLPSDGWDSASERRRFIRAVPPQASYQVVNGKGEVLMSGVGELPGES